MWRPNTRRIRLAAGWVALALVATACGGDNDGGSLGGIGNENAFEAPAGSEGEPSTDGIPSGEEMADEIVQDALDLQLGNEPSNDSRALQLDVEAITGFQADALAVEGTTLWMADTENDVVRSYDVTTREQSDDIAVGGDPAGIAVDGTEVWVANSSPDDHTVVRIDAAAGEVDLTVDIGAGSSPTGIALTDEYVWVGVGSRGAVAQIDRASGELLGVVAEDPSNLSGGQMIDVLATDLGVYSIDRFCGRVVRIDPTTATIVSVFDDLGYVAGNPDTCTGSVDANGPTRLAAFEGGVFVLASVLNDAGQPAGRIYRIDEASGEVAPIIDLLFTPPASIRRHGLPGLVVEPGGIWLSGGDRSVRMDRETGRFDGAFAVETVVALIGVEGDIWHAVVDPFFDGPNSGLYGVDAAAASVAAS